MGVDWMTKREINEAIPPAYALHIGRHAMATLAVRLAAALNVRQASARGSR